MSNFREATFHARRGNTIKRGARTLRFLTDEEALPIILDRGGHKGLKNPGKLLGIFDVSDPKNLQEWRPSDEDKSAEDWELS